MSGSDERRGWSVAIVGWVLGNRRTTVAALALLTLLAAGLATQIGVSFSSRDFFATSDDGARDTAALDAFNRRWGADDATLLVLATSDDDLRTPAGLAAVAAVATDLRGAPSVRSAVSLAQAAAAVGPTALRQPPVTPALVAADGHATVIALELDTSSDDLAAVIPVVAKLQARVDALDGEHGLRLALAGVPAVRAAFFTLAVRDQLVLGPIVSVVVALVLWLAFRRVHAVLVPMLAAGLPMVWLLGTMAACGEPVGLLNQAFFTLLPVIAIADGVHWVVRVDEEVERHPQDRAAAIVAAASGVGRACVLTSLTTAAGFVSLLLVDVAILRRFGGWAAVGIGYAWLSVVVVAPLVLSWTTTPPVDNSRSSTAHAMTRWSMNNPAIAIIFGVSLLAGTASLASSLPVDNRLGDLLPTTHPVRAASDVVDNQLGGILTLEVELSGVQTAPAQALAQWAQRQPEVRWVGVAEQLGAPWSMSEEHTRVSLHTADVGGQAFAALAERTRGQLASTQTDGVVTSTALVAYTGVNRIATRLQTSLVGLLVVVTIMIGVALRSFRLAMIAIPVNVLPLMLAAGVLALLGATLDPLAAVIVAVALGIAVDDTLHLLARTREELARGRAPHEAMLHASGHSGRALVVTTAALAAGLLVQLLSSFPPLRMLGGLGTIVVVGALVADLTLLPALFAVSARRDA